MTRDDDRPGHPPADDSTSKAGRIEGMSLADGRAEIEEVDHDLVRLIARRTYVADTIARIKAEREIPTTDEKQERRVMERAGDYAARFGVDDNLVKAIFRLLIELNKIEQRQNAEPSEHGSDPGTGG